MSITYIHTYIAEFIYIGLPNWGWTSPNDNKNPYNSSSTSASCDHYVVYWQYQAWEPKKPNMNFCISRGIVATLFRWTVRVYNFLVRNFLIDSVYQKLRTSVHFSPSCSKYKKEDVFRHTVYSQSVAPCKPVSSHSCSDQSIMYRLLLNGQGQQISIGSDATVMLYTWRSTSYSEAVFNVDRF